MRPRIIHHRETRTTSQVSRVPSPWVSDSRDKTHIRRPVIRYPEVRHKFGFDAQAPSIGDRITDYVAMHRAETFAAMETEAPGWGGHLSELGQKIDALRGILADPGCDLPPHVLQKIEDEMISAKAHLDEALRSARETSAS